MLIDNHVLYGNFAADFYHNDGKQEPDHIPQQIDYTIRRLGKQCRQQFDSKMPVVLDP